MKNIHIEIKDLKDVTRKSCQIRSMVSRARTISALSLLHKRQSYLVTLTSSPTFKSNFRGHTESLRNLAMREYNKTAKLINKRARSLAIDKKYDENWATQN